MVGRLRRPRPSRPNAHPSPYVKCMYIVINSELSYTTRNKYILHQKRGRIVHSAHNYSHYVRTTYKTSNYIHLLGIQAMLMVSPSVPMDKLSLVEVLTIQLNSGICLPGKNYARSKPILKLGSYQYCSALMDSSL